MEMDWGGVTNALNKAVSSMKKMLDDTVLGDILEQALASVLSEDGLHTTLSAFPSWSVSVGGGRGRGVDVLGYMF